MSITIPTNEFGYFCFIFSVNLEQLSLDTSIPLDRIKKFYNLGTHSATIRELILINEYLGINIPYKIKHTSKKRVKFTHDS